ncbi:hypothetical protein N9K72_00945 [Pontimonas sp.]|nr:hypothetical protein [Pontimonas sp.]
MVGEETNGGEGSSPRRSTFVPPADDTSSEDDVVAETLGSTSPEPTPSQVEPKQPVSDDPLAYPPAPLKQSVPVNIAVAEATDTESMMERLEAQIALQRAEEESFRAWADAVKESHPGFAEAIIAHERAIFDGAERTEFRLEPAEDTLSEMPDADDLNDGEPSTAIEDSTGSDALSQLAGDDLSSIHEPEDSPQLPDNSTDPVADPLAVAPATKARAPRPLSPTRWSLISTWQIALIPLLALTPGLWFVARGTDYSEALAALAVAALVVGLVIAGLTRSRTPLRDTFGSVGSLMPGVALMGLRLAVLALVVGWSSSVAAEIAALSGLWPGSAEQAQILAAALLGASAIVHLFFSAPVVRVTVWGSAVLGLLGSAALMWRTVPEIPTVPSWDTPDDAVAVLSAAAILVAAGVGLLAPLASNMAGLVAFRKVRAQGLWAGIASMVPLAALLGFVIVLASSTPEFAANVLADPVRTLAIGLGTWFPVPALLVLVIPFVGLLVVGLSAVTSSLQDMSVPAPRVVLAIAVAVLFVAAVFAGLVWSDVVSDAMPDLVTTLGVCFGAWAGITAMNAMLPGRPSGDRPLRVRAGNLLGLGVAVALGFGVTSSSVSWLSWQGYLVDFVTVEGLGVLAEGSMGVLLALAMGALFGLISFVFSLARKGNPRVGS